MRNRFVEAAAPALIGSVSHIRVRSRQSPHQAALNAVRQTGLAEYEISPAGQLPLCGDSRAVRSRWIGRVKSFRSHVKGRPDARRRRRGDAAGNEGEAPRAGASASCSRLSLFVLDSGTQLARLWADPRAGVVRLGGCRSCKSSPIAAPATRPKGMLPRRASRGHRAVIARSSRSPQRGFAAVAAAARRPRARPRPPQALLHRGVRHPLRQYLTNWMRACAR